MRAHYGKWLGELGLGLQRARGARVGHDHRRVEAVGGAVGDPRQPAHELDRALVDVGAGERAGELDHRARCERGERGAHGGLFSVDFFRIILDEAHFIKNRQSKTAKACYELAARHRWVLTGTPIVNRLEDLFSTEISPMREN